MSRYGEHNTSFAKLKLGLGNRIEPESIKNSLITLAKDWITSSNLSIKDINKHPITGK
jgi:hypothetical protein